jgi:aspartyl-tRNA(Asn)/glutamyl-tRNA(Gln) amidotransferase subunit A
LQANHTTVETSGPLAYAAPLEPAAADGPLAGRKVTVQANMSVQGWPTEANSLALEGFVAIETAVAVDRLAGAGAGIVGSTRSAELGFGLVDDAAAQALVEGRCDAALVTDTLGEARHVALRARLVGLKPSWGIVPRVGLIGLVPSMEAWGAVAGSPAALLDLVAAIAGPDERDPSMLAEGVPDFAPERLAQHAVESVGVVRECVAMLDPVETQAFDAGLARLRRAGLDVREVSLSDFELARLVHHVVGSVEASSATGKYDGVRYGHRAQGAANWNEMYLRSREESFGTLVKAYIFQGAYFQFEDYDAFVAACRIRRRLVEAADALLAEVGVLALPVQRRGRDAYAAATVDDVYDAFELTLGANVIGGPALSMAGLAVAEGADVGLQLVGRHLADMELLWLAQRLAAEEGWKA